MKVKIFLFVGFCFLSQSISAQTVFAKYAGEFMAIGVGGKALAMGGAQVALVNDVTSGYWNPAGLAKLDYPQFSLMHEEHFGDLVNYNRRLGVVIISTSQGVMTTKMAAKKNLGGELICRIW